MGLNHMTTDATSALRAQVSELRRLADDIARAGIKGFGNRATMIADELEALTADAADYVRDGRKHLKPLQDLASAYTPESETGAALRAAIEALTSNTPPDYVRVPREPTPEMIEAFARAPEHENGHEELRIAWRAMLAAAPTAEGTRTEGETE